MTIGARLSCHSVRRSFCITFRGNLPVSHARIRLRSTPDETARTQPEAFYAADLESLPDAPVFCSIRKGDHVKSTEPLTDDGIYRMMTRRAEQLGIQDFSPHDLRRTYATRLLQMGGDINIVRQAMGHASIATTQRYDRRGEDEVRRLTSRLVF